MGEINLKQVAQRYLVHEMNSANFIVNHRYLVQEVIDNSDVTKLIFLEQLNKHLNLGYSFTPSTLKYWHLSPLKIVDPENKKVTRVRISALNGNGKYSGFRDFTYNRIDLADYCKSLTLHSISDAYLSSDDSETIYNLLGLRFSTGEVDITVTELEGVTTYTVTVVDENSLLWYGTGQIVVTNLPHVSKFIKTNSLVFFD